MTLISKNFSEVITFSRGTGATRLNSAGLIVGVDFSVTSNAIATGSKTFTITADANVNRDWPVGSNVIAVSQAGATGSMTGTVTSYTPSTQSLVINVTSVTGSGTSTDWRIGSLDVREDYDPVTLAKKGVLSEGTATNITTNSGLIASAGFTQTNSTISSTQGVSPDGSNNAAKLIGSSGVSGSNTKINNVFTVTAGLFYTFSIFLKKAEFNKAVITYIGAFGVTEQLQGEFDLTNGIASNLSTAKISSYGNGWYLCSVTYQATGGTGGFQIQNASSVVGDGVSGFLMFGAQTTASASPSSYIPTTTAQVTRNADNFPLTAAAVASIRQGESTLYAEIDCPDTGAAQKRAFRLSGTNADIRIGKQGTGTLSSFSKMAEGAGLRLMGTSTSLIRGNGQDLVAVTAINDRLGTAAAIPVVNAVAFDGANRFALASSSTGTSAVEEVFVDGLLGTFSGKGAGDVALNNSFYNGSRFIVAVNSVGFVFVSTDGTSYRKINTSVLSQPTTEIVSGLVGATTRNVIVGAAGFIATSDDNGDTWTARASGVATDFVSVAYAPTTFVALSSIAANTRYSLDGITWSAVTGLTGTTRSIAYTGSQFVAINSTGGVFTSANGQVFTAVTTTGITPAFTAAQGITYANGFYTIVGNGGQIAISQTAAAASPATWTTFVTAQTGTSSNLQKVSSFSGSFYAVGDAQTIIKFSQSLTPTFSSPSAGVNGGLRGVSASATTLLITGGSSAISFSTDGTTFTSRTNNGSTLNGIAFGNNVFVSVGNAANGSGYIATIAADGTVTRRVSGTTSSLINAKFINGAFYATRQGGLQRATDPTGTWSSVTLGGITTTYSVAFGANMVVALSDGGGARVHVSNDNGVTFGGATSVNDMPNTPQDIDFANGVFVVVGTGGNIYTTTTPQTAASWTKRTSGTTANLNSVMFSTRDQLWYAAGNGGTLLYSPDAITWTAVQNFGTASILGTTLQSNQPLPQFKSGVNKIALSYKSNQVISALNGVASTTDTTATIPSITAGTIGENFNGTIQKIEVLDSALTTSEIIEKTL